MNEIKNNFNNIPPTFKLLIFDDHLSHSHYKISISITEARTFDFSLSSGSETEYDEWESEQHLFMESIVLEELYIAIKKKNNVENLFNIIESHINKIDTKWDKKYQKLFALLMEYYSNDQAFLKFKLLLEHNDIKYSETNEFEEYIN